MSSTVGIDIEQFMRDPYATGIQRVLQYLAKQWPVDFQADFVVPFPQTDDSFVLLEPPLAAKLLSLPFERPSSRSQLKKIVDMWIVDNSTRVLAEQQLNEMFDSWLLPEVSYLQSVINRFEDFRRHAYTSMIGYDILPMIEPLNYRFTPGRSAWVSEYFRMLVVADSVSCISEFAKCGLVERLRRPELKATQIAHPGGDHIPVRSGLPPERLTFIRVGTMEARKKPIEILSNFLFAADQGLEADLVFVGAPSASDLAINVRIENAIHDGYPVRWRQNASDDEVYDTIQRSTAFLSFGIEGYGIPVLEAIRLGTPVIYSGEQPAAQLMDGCGAIREKASVPWTRVSNRELAQARNDLRPAQVPTWKAFAQKVAAFAYPAKQ